MTVEVGEVRAYFQAFVGERESVPMRVMSVDGDKVIARPVGADNFKPITYDLADFERWYPIVCGEPIVVTDDLVVANPNASARVFPA